MPGAEVHLQEKVARGAEVSDLLGMAAPDSALGRVTAGGRASPATRSFAGRGGGAVNEPPVCGQGIRRVATRE